MRFVLVCTAALLAAPAFADELVASNGSDSVRLSDRQCASEKVLEQIPSEMRALLKDATATVNGETFKACWVADQQAAHLVYEDGDQGLVPLAELRKPG